MNIECSIHMIGNKEFFGSIDEEVKRKIKFLNNNIVTTEGMDKFFDSK